jgi:putative flavoprotein involved in K+ transport
VLQNKGVRLAGRAVSVGGARVRFATDLEDKVAAADGQMYQLLAKIDQFIESSGTEARATEPDLPEPIRPHTAPCEVDLTQDGIRTVVWATGYERRYPWLKVPVVGRSWRDSSRWRAHAGARAVRAWHAIPKAQELQSN